jgi:hypothetical protein
MRMFVSPERIPRNAQGELWVKGMRSASQTQFCMDEVSKMKFLISVNGKVEKEKVLRVEVALRASISHNPPHVESGLYHHNRM